MRNRLIFVAVLVDVAIVLLSPTTALAAMIATLSSTHARPGDSVLLLTDDQKGTWRYEGLSSEYRQPIYLAPITGKPADACGGAGSQMVGQLQWRGNAAGVTFIVPNLPLADYWLFMETNGQCWRVGAMVGRLAQPLVLSIGTTPAENQDVVKRWTVDSLPSPKPVPQTTSSSSTPQPLFAIIGGIFMLTVLVIGLRRQRFRARSSRR
jgi:hypothetical protein